MRVLRHHALLKGSARGSLRRADHAAHLLSHPPRTVSAACSHVDAAVKAC